MAEAKKHYTVRRLAEEWDCDIGTIYKLINEKLLGCLKIGTAIRVPVAAKEAYEEQNTICPETKMKSQHSSSEELSASHVTMSHGQKVVGLNAFQRALMTKRQQNNTSPTV